VGLRTLEAVGPTANRNLFQLTFTTEEAANEFLSAGDFTVKGRAAKVSMVTKTKFRIQGSLGTALRTYEYDNQCFGTIGDLKVQHAHNEKSRVKGYEHVFTLVRSFTVTADFCRRHSVFYIMAF
jgi:hypothetical protein